MKVRILVAVAVAAAVGVTASSAGGSTARSAASITVWLQNDAQNGWPDLVASVNQQFQKQHPGVDVNVQYQTWPTHLQKFDATLAGGNAPDVVEMGTTEMTKYMAAGAFQDLTSEKSSFANSAKWLKALKDSATYGGRLYGVPYYGGARIVTYRTDLFKKAGAASLPRAWRRTPRCAKKLAAQNPGKGFSPVYIAGQDWYVAHWLRLRLRRPDRQGLPWQVAGHPRLTEGDCRADGVQEVLRRRLEGQQVDDRDEPWPYEVYAQGQAASMIGSSWFSCCVGDKYKGVTGQFVMPSHTKGKPIPGFLGGSDLAAPIGANKALAVDWIKAFTEHRVAEGPPGEGEHPERLEPRSGTA